jgi:hypothetical protein
MLNIRESLYFFRFLLSTFQVFDVTPTLSVDIVVALPSFTAWTEWG